MDPRCRSSIGHGAPGAQRSEHPRAQGRRVGGVHRGERVSDAVELTVEDKREQLGERKNGAVEEEGTCCGHASSLPAGHLFVRVTSESGENRSA
jgi:hypothetical protein